MVRAAPMSRLCRSSTGFHAERENASAWAVTALLHNWDDLPFFRI